MDYVQPFTFNGIRSLIGGLVLIPCIFLLNRKKSSHTQPAAHNRDLVLGGILCGLCLFSASSFQQFGIQYTTVGKAGFITACYIVIVPILGLFLRKMYAADLGQRPVSPGRFIFSLYRRIFLPQSGRRPGLHQRSLVFCPYPGD